MTSPISPEPTAGVLPLVSIILPVYNESRYIEECLASIEEQDYPADRREVLVCDGRSSDNTRDLVERFAAGHAGYRLVDNPGRTQVKAFNLGVAQARGEVVIRLDAHARYERSYIRKCVETLGKTGAANVGGACQTMPGGTGLIARSIAVLGTQRFGIGGARFRVGGQAGPVDTVPFGAFRKDVFEKVGTMNELLVRGEDNEFNSRLRGAALTVYFNPEIVCTYFARPTIRGFLGQMFGNGLYHVLTLMVNPAGCSVRHLIPFGFVMTMILCAAVGLLWHPVWYVGAAIVGLYLLADLAASAAAAAKEGAVYFLILPWLFPLVHCGYGIGTLAGVFKFALPAVFGKRTAG